MTLWKTKTAALLRKAVSWLDEVNDSACDAFTDALTRGVRRFGLPLTVAALLAGGGMAAGGAGILFQATFRALGTGAVDRSAMSKLRDNVSVKDFGAVCDDIADDTASVQAAITFLTGSAGAGKGGTVNFPNATCKMLGQLTFPNDGGTVPKQPSIRLTGAGAHFEGQTNTPRGGTILDMRYSGAVAKIDTRGLGTLEIDHLTLASLGGSDSTAFIQTTNTTLLLHDTGFFGNTALTGTQDAIILGGTSTSNDGTSDSYFQGYGTTIIGNYFNRIRRALYCRSACNSITFTHNTVWAASGFSTGAPIDIDGNATASFQATGNNVSFNLLELVGYKYGIRIGHGLSTTLTNNNFWDPTATTSAYYLIDTGAQDTQILDGWHDTTKPVISDTVGIATSHTTLITGRTGTASQIATGGSGWSWDGPITVNTNGGSTLTTTAPATSDSTVMGQVTGANGGLSVTYNPAGAGAVGLGSLHRQGAGVTFLDLQGTSGNFVNAASGTDLKLTSRNAGNVVFLCGGNAACNTFAAADGSLHNSIATGTAPLVITSTTPVANLTVQNLDSPAFTAVLQAALGTPANGTVKYCSDCTIANPCAGAGTGAIAKRLNGVWVCN